MTRVPVNPDLLRWARERSGLAQDDLTTRFRKLPEWESGETRPTLKQMEAFARAVHVPVGYLFLTDPPKELVLRSTLSTRSRLPMPASDSVSGA